MLASAIDLKNDMLEKHLLTMSYCCDILGYYCLLPFFFQYPYSAHLCRMYPNPPNICIGFAFENSDQTFDDPSHRWNLISVLYLGYPSSATSLSLQIQPMWRSTPMHQVGLPTHGPAARRVRGLVLQQAWQLSMK